MSTGLLHLHSSMRYLVLLFIVLAILDAAVGMSQGKTYSKSSKLFALLGLIFSHIQLLVGLVLYFIGARGFNSTSVEGFMQDPALRFFAMEHLTGMIIAIALITIGYSRSKKQEVDRKKHSTILVFYGIALLIIFMMIPWPFLKSFGTWM